MKKYNNDQIRAEAESYLNGNISNFKQFLKKCSKLDLLNLLEVLQGMGYKRHNSINRIRGYLEENLMEKIDYK